VRILSGDRNVDGANRRRRRLLATSGSLARSAEPAAALQTFLAGQPMLMSMTCAPRATFVACSSAIIEAQRLRSAPREGRSRPLVDAAEAIVPCRRAAGLDAPFRRRRIRAELLASMRNGARSVTPAIGATARLFGNA
jgi:hypothetical protein